MKRKIINFHQDEESHWVADLNCGHAQHTRHNPPLIERTWVLSATGRQAHLGTELNCVCCDERIIPDQAVLLRRTAVFTEETIPAALRKEHRSGEGVWGRIVVESGTLQYAVFTPYDEVQILDTAHPGVIVPEVLHAVTPMGTVSFMVEFYKVDLYKAAT